MSEEVRPARSELAGRVEDDGDAPCVAVTKASPGELRPGLGIRGYAWSAMVIAMS